MRTKSNAWCSSHETSLVVHLLFYHLFQILSLNKIWNFSQFVTQTTEVKSRMDSSKINRSFIVRIKCFFVCFVYSSVFCIRFFCCILVCFLQLGLSSLRLNFSQFHRQTHVAFDLKLAFEKCLIGKREPFVIIVILQIQAFLINQT